MSIEHWTLSIEHYLLPILIRSAGSRRTGKELFATGKSNIATVGALGAVFRQITDDNENCRRGTDCFVQPRLSNEFGGPSSIDPSRDCAVRILHIDMQPGVRVDPLHLRDGSF